MKSALRSWVKFLLWRTTRIRPSRLTGEDWDRSYAAGAWRRLEDLDELAHYSVIAGYARATAPRTLLDVACGHGVLAGHLKMLPYSRYIGIDLSAQAINEALNRHGDERTHFLISDAREFSSSEAFDLIIFNECLYFLGAVRDTVRRYSDLLTPGGRMIVSMWTAPQNRAVWPEVEADMAIDDAVTVQNQGTGTGWTVKLLSPHIRG